MASTEKPRRVHRSAEEIDAREFKRGTREAAMREIERLTAEHENDAFTIDNASGVPKAGYMGMDMGAKGRDQGDQGDQGGGYVCRDCKAVVEKGQRHCRCGTELDWRGVA